MKKSQTGFTLVELVVVILILGILGATALPRFLNVNTEAHQAAVSGAGGGFGAGIALVHAQWIANGSTGSITAVTNFGSGNVAVNTSGWPTDTAGSGATLSSTTDCIQVWNGIMQNPPTVSAAGTGTDYAVALSGATGCTFTYQGASTMTIGYQSTTGAVIVDAVIP